MKRAKPQKILSALLQAHVLAYDADDVRLLLDPIREAACFRHGCLKMASPFGKLTRQKDG
jgi:hypothetical protein